jgi:ATP-dependent Zn protease
MLRFIPTSGPRQGFISAPVVPDEHVRRSEEVDSGRFWHRSLTPTRKDRLCIHESGHATLAKLLGLTVHSISVGHFRHPDGRLATGDGRVDVMLGIPADNMILVYGGSAAEALKFGKSDVSSSRTDREMAKKFATGAGLEHLLGKAQFHAFQLLRKNWTAVEMIADALMQHDSLTGRQVDELMEKAAKITAERDARYKRMERRMRVVGML